MKNLYIALLLSCCSILPLFSMQGTEMPQSSDILNVTKENSNEQILSKVKDLLQKGAQPDETVIDALIDRAGEQYKQFRNSDNFKLLEDTSTALARVLNKSKNITSEHLAKAKRLLGESPDVEPARLIINMLSVKSIDKASQAKGKGKA